MFFQEILLIGYIILSLLYICFIKLQNGYANFTIYKTKFLILQNFGLLLLGCIWAFNFSLLYSLDFPEPIIDKLYFITFLDNFITETFGVCFFRLDLLTVILNLFLTTMFLVYMFLVKYLMQSTKIYYKYIVEIPVLIIVIFFSLRIFLLTFDLILIILALELAAFCSVILIGLQISSKENSLTLEAAIKYFLFNAVSVLLLIFGISGYYFSFKAINLLDFQLPLMYNSILIFMDLETLLLFHFFFFFAFFFKLGAAPFHFWVPDVYEGAELLITAFLVLIISPTVLVKFFLLTKLLLPTSELNHYLLFGFYFVGLLSLVFGTFQAFQQYKTKRFLAFTSITHLGYMLLSLGTCSYLGFFASFFYLLIYLVTNILFFIILLLVRQQKDFSLLFLNHFKMIFTGNLICLSFFLIPIFSYAGFPPFLGFFAKFFVLLTLIDNNQILMAGTLILYIVINGYLYLRFIKMAIFEKITFQFFLPTLQDSNYYQVKIFSNINKTLTITNVILVFVLFFISLFLVFGSFFLPQLTTFLTQLLFTVFLFY